MQVNGMNEFLSRFTTTSSLTPGLANFASPVFALQKYTPKNTSDTLAFSDIGKKLSLNMRPEGVKQLVDNKAKKDVTNDPWWKLADKSLATAQDILERMHSLAVAAQDESLSDLERVEIQIELEDLGANFMAVPANINEQMEGRSPIGSDFFREKEEGNSFLERMRERILKGQDWNVREVYAPEDFMRDVSDENGPAVEVYEADTWYVVDEASANIKSLGVSGAKETGDKVRTARETLESGTPVVVMDAKSATEGVKYLEQQIKTVQKWREQHHKNNSSDGIYKQKQLYGVYMNLDRIAYSGRQRGLLLNEGVEAFRYYLLEEGVNTNPHATRVHETLERLKGSNIPLAGTDMEKIKNNESYVLDVLNEAEVVTIPPDEIEIRYADGVSWSGQRERIERERKAQDI